MTIKDHQHFTKANDKTETARDGKAYRFVLPDALATGSSTL